MLTPLLLTAAAALAPTSEGLQWYEGSLDQAIAQARTNDSHVMVYFWRNGSDHCTALYQETLQNEAVPGALGDIVCLSANYDDKAGAKMFETFNVSTLPTMLFLAPDGKPDDTIQGFIDPESFAQELARIQRGEGTLSGLTKAAAAAEAGSDAAVEACWLLAGKQQDLGDQHAHDATLAALRETHDPEGRTLIGARAHRWLIEGTLNQELAASGECAGEECSDECDHEGRAAKVDFAPLYAFAKEVSLDEARFEAWNSVANFEASRRSADKAVKAFEKAYPLAPAAQRVSYPKGVAMWAVGAGDEATKAQKKMALKFALAAVKTAKKMDPESEDCKEACGDSELHMVQAEATAALAMVYDLHGNDRKAKKTAQDALALAGDHADSYREYLGAILN